MSLRWSASSNCICGHHREIELDGVAYVNTVENAGTGANKGYLPVITGQLVRLFSFLSSLQFPDFALKDSNAETGA